MKVVQTFLLAALCLAAAPEPGFVPLFNGKDLRGWRLVRGRGPGYLMRDGILTCPADGGGNLLSEKEYADFVLRLEFRMEQGGNNGIGIRTPFEGRVSSVGMEIQILDDDGPRYKGRLHPEQYTGSVYGVIPARSGFLRPAGEWNDYEITADGRRIRVRLNGVIVLDSNLDIVEEPAVLAKHPGLARSSGHIGFLGHGTLVEFRNVRLRELP